jgi:hypothetical protein
MFIALLLLPPQEFEEYSRLIGSLSGGLPHDRSEPCATSKEIVLRLTSNREYDLSQDSGAEVGFQRVPNPTIQDRFDGIVLKWLICATRSLQCVSAGPGKANI